MQVHMHIYIYVHNCCEMLPITIFHPARDFTTHPSSDERWLINCPLITTRTIQKYVKFHSTECLVSTLIRPMIFYHLHNLATLYNVDMPDWVSLRFFSWAESSCYLCLHAKNLGHFCNHTKLSSLCII